MDETKLPPIFAHVRKLHYRPFALHIALFQVMFSDAQSRVSGGLERLTKGKNSLFNPLMLDYQAFDFFNPLQIAISR